MRHMYPCVKILRVKQPLSTQVLFLFTRFTLFEQKYLTLHKHVPTMASPDVGMPSDGSCYAEQRKKDPTKPKAVLFPPKQSDPNGIHLAGIRCRRRDRRLNPNPLLGAGRPRAGLRVPPLPALQLPGPHPVRVRHALY
jgi:hypothetical protein